MGVFTSEPPVCFSIITTDDEHTTYDDDDSPHLVRTDRCSCGFRTQSHNEKVSARVVQCRWVELSMPVNDLEVHDVAIPKSKAPRSQKSVAMTVCAQANQMSDPCKSHAKHL